jgi:hypothetical protein
LSVTVTTAPIDVAVNKLEVAVVRLMAAARFAASVVVSADVAKFVVVLVPSVPPVSVAAAQAKHVARVFPSAMLLPAVPFIAAVTVVVLVMPVLRGVALTPKPKAVWQRLIAAARLNDRVVVVLLVANVAVANVGHAFAPFAPALGLPHVKTPLASAVVSVGVVPGVTWVTVVVLVLDVAVALTAVKEVWQLLIAVARFEARVLLLVLFVNVPAVETVGHVFVPSVPAVTLPQLKTLAEKAGDKVIKLPGAAADTVVALPLEVAVTPTAGKAVSQLLIASLRLAASVLVVALVKNAPAVELVQPGPNPIVAPLTAMLLPTLAKVMLVWVTFVTVTTPELTVAVALGLAVVALPKQGLALPHWVLFASIAALKFAAELLVPEIKTQLAVVPHEVVENV